MTVTAEQTVAELRKAVETSTLVGNERERWLSVSASTIIALLDKYAEMEKALRQISIMVDMEKAREVAAITLTEKPRSQTGQPRLEHLPD